MNAEDFLKDTSLKSSQMIAWISQLAQWLNNLPANAGDLQEMQVRSLGQEVPLQEDMATHSSILA